MSGVELSVSSPIAGCVSSEALLAADAVDAIASVVDCATNLVLGDHSEARVALRPSGAGLDVVMSVCRTL